MTSAAQKDLVTRLRAAAGLWEEQEEHLAGEVLRQVADQLEADLTHELEPCGACGGSHEKRVLFVKLACNRCSEQGYVTA